jgi:hypothetical protein
MKCINLCVVVGLSGALAMVPVTPAFQRGGLIQMTRAEARQTLPPNCPRLGVCPAGTRRQCTSYGRCYDPHANLGVRFNACMQAVCTRARLPHWR